MRGPLARLVGMITCAAGVLFTLQGVGLVKGSFMSNTTTWTVLGPLIAVTGAAITYRAARR